jgi:hypothetical protein
MIDNTHVVVLRGNGCRHNWRLPDSFAAAEGIRHASAGWSLRWLRPGSHTGSGFNSGRSTA